MLHKFVFFVVMAVMITYVMSALYELIHKMLFWRHLKRFKGKYVIAKINRDYETEKFKGFYYLIRINEDGWAAGELSDRILMFDNQADAIKKLLKYKNKSDLLVMQI